MAIKHTKVSTVPDGTDADLVRPSDWNAEHEITVEITTPEVRLTPKDSSSGPEGTMFYNETDKCVYVGVEV